MSRVLFCLLCLSLSTSTVSATLSLNNNASMIKYRATKYGSMLVEGDMTQKAQASLTGQLSVNDLLQAKDLRGRVVLLHPEFKSDSYRRDLEVNQLLSKDQAQGIQIEILNVDGYQPGPGILTVKLRLSVNGVNKPQLVSAVLARDEEGIWVTGELDIDREFYGLVFTGFAGTFDMAIQKIIKIDYELLFEIDEPFRQIQWPSIPDKADSERGLEQEMGLWKSIQETLKSLF